MVNIMLSSRFEHVQYLDFTFKISVTNSHNVIDLIPREYLCYFIGARGKRFQRPVRYSSDVYMLQI